VWSTFGAVISKFWKTCFVVVSPTTWRQTCKAFHRLDTLLSGNAM
jgi:hypothetical protein